MRQRKSRLFGLTVLAGLTLTIVGASLVVGAQPTSLQQVWHALFTATGSSSDTLIRSLRVPRTILGAMVGLALGTAGALLQGHTRNPLADTGLFGMNAGAAFAIVLAIHVCGFSGTDGYVWFALLGSFVAGLVVFGIASIGHGGASPLSLALAGAAITFFLQAMTNALTVVDATAFHSARFWVVGALAGRNIHVAAAVAPFLVVGLMLAAINAPALNALQLGEDTARSLGSSVARTRVIGLTAITLLSGAATAACGPIAFLGLMVPHIARRITGPDHRWLIPCSGLLGVLVLLTADIVGRVVISPAELSVGVMVAIVGAPSFVLVVRRRRLVTL